MVSLLEPTQKNVIPRRLALCIEYDGTPYNGFQSQSTANTVQDKIEEALFKLTHTNTRIKAAGRTDSGTHAIQQIISLDVNNDYSPTTYIKALNYFLPPAIRVKSAMDVQPTFDPRRDAISRVYRYTIANQETAPALERNQVHWIRQRLNVKNMHAAAQYLVGTHDFKEFAAPMQNSKSTIRKMFRSEVWKENNSIFVELEANAFLTHQVRKIVSVLVGVGIGKASPTIILDALNKNITLDKWAPVPAKGLCLLQVKYPNIMWKKEGSYAHEKF